MLSSLLFLLNSAFVVAPPPHCESEDRTCVVIEINQSQTLDNFGPLAFSGITEDSRCPADVFCLWEGQVRIDLQRQTENGIESIDIGLGGDLANSYTDSIGSRRLILEEVWPQPSYSNPIEAPYQIKLRLEEIPAH